MKQIGRYEIERELGRGAMGVVFAAVDPLIGRQVAIKTIRLGSLEAETGHAELKQRLRREAQAAGVLSHPGILTIYDVGEHGEDAYIVMEFIDGQTVEEMLVSGAVQHSGTLLSILNKTADALDFAHSKGIIHRDIKPSNIMVCADGAVKIADFGVAKLTASSSMTQSGFVLGTPNYMSPEQAQGRPIDGRADQFSLAVVAYRMLTGKLPFEGSTLTALLSKILWEEPEYESAGLKPPVRAVFEKALMKDPQRRYPNCTQFVSELASAYTGAGPGSELALPSAAELEMDGDFNSGLQHFTSRPPAAAAQKPQRRSRILAGAVALGIVLLAAIAFYAHKSIKAPAPAVPQASMKVAPIPKETAAELAPSLEESKPPQKEEAAAAAPLPRRQAEEKTAATPEISVPKPKAIPSPAVRSQPESGIITWSGDLGKNSILVLSEQTATIGSVEGQLPGKPVHIEVEPKDLLIRQKPGENNRWSQIILYSGNRQYSSITIRWKLIE